MIHTLALSLVAIRTVIGILFKRINRLEWRRVEIRSRRKKNQKYSSSRRKISSNRLTPISSKHSPNKTPEQNSTAPSISSRVAVSTTIQREQIERRRTDYSKEIESRYRLRAVSEDRLFEEYRLRKIQPVNEQQEF